MLWCGGQQKGRRRERASSSPGGPGGVTSELMMRQNRNNSASKSPGYFTAFTCLFSDYLQPFGALARAPFRRHRRRLPKERPSRLLLRRRRPPLCRHTHTHGDDGAGALPLLLGAPLWRRVVPIRGLDAVRRPRERVGVVLLAAGEGALRLRAREALRRLARAAVAMGAPRKSSPQPTTFPRVTAVCCESRGVNTFSRTLTPASPPSCASRSPSPPRPAGSSPASTTATAPPPRTRPAPRGG